MNSRFFPIIRRRSNYRNLFMGIDSPVPLRDGSSIPGINFDNGATTPPLWAVMNEINSFATNYGSVHRGTGYKSIISSELYEQARKEVLRFVGGDYQRDTVIFVKNTTEALNKLANRLYSKHKNGMVLTTWMEHHSNLLPWREKFQIDYIEIDEQGRLRLDDLQAKLERYQGLVKLVTVSGASNVTGHRNPIHRIAEIVHRYGAKICVDGAQLVPHAPVNMGPSNSLEHIDYLAFSGHKMYAPFGTGVLIGPRETFEEGAPDYTGGGTARIVTPDKVIWYEAPRREEAGTPNLMGVVALLAAMRTLSALGMKRVQAHEEELLAYTYEKLRWLGGLYFYGGIPLSKEQLSQRIGVISFNVAGMYHQEVAEFLAQEGGISVRNGCFCAQPYVQRLMNISREQIELHMANPTLPQPGMVRISFGLYNTKEEVDRLIEVMSRIVRKQTWSVSGNKISQAMGSKVDMEKKKHIG